jgi:hypothetical protein
VDAKQLRGMKLDEVLSWTGRNDPGSPNHDRGMAELRFREIGLQMKSSEAQIEAANAQKKAADAAVTNNYYLLASVIVAALAAVMSAISAFVLIHPAWFK